MKTYSTKQTISFAIVSVLSLALPSLIYAIYLLYHRILNYTPPSVLGVEAAPETAPVSVLNQFFQGLLLIPWQIKRHLDNLYFTCQRLCPLQTVKEGDEKILFSLERNAELLEFFENFYAGFLQILLQLYILSLQFSLNDAKDGDLFRKCFVIVNLSIIDFYSLHLVWGEVIGSGLSVFSMLIAVRRRDDGPMTWFFSFFGWSSLFVSRSVVFALAVSVFGWYFVALASAHVLFFTWWVYGIARESYGQVLTGIGETSAPTTNQSRATPSLVLTFFFFGLPSLVLWPFMFQLKEKGRHMKFLMTVAVENGLLLLAWYGLHKWRNHEPNLASLLLVVITTVVSVLFLSLYGLCKPPKTELVVLYDDSTSSNSFGIYYEFFKIVFNPKVSQRFAQQLEELRH